MENAQWEVEFNKVFSVIDANMEKPVIGRRIEGKKAGGDYIEHIPTKEIKDYIRQEIEKAYSRGYYEGANQGSKRNDAKLASQ